MKTTDSVKAVLMAITTLFILVSIFATSAHNLSQKQEYVSENKTALEENTVTIMPAITVANAEIKDLAVSTEVKEENIAVGQTEAEKIKEEKDNQIVYDGMTLKQLAEKLDRSLNSTISGQGYTFASLATELGIDPYLAVAIVMHETGCKWTCSSLMQTCNNVGGMKSGGNGTCNGGSYASFPTLEEGIKAYMNNLYKNYASQGLTTAEAMAPKYAASTTWASQVNAYINEIKAA